uniref:NADH-ubiquinone oxidoreductase chain 4L n=1 Tax=Exema canadensis TaxID=294585 RepID=U3KZS0_9CUCU|nr:NADH dehydrogenase subunit 4L [Exema canadensis]
MKSLMLIVLLMFFSGLFSYSFFRKHLLLMLLSLEFLVLVLYLGMFMYLDLVNYEYFFSMIYLTMAVCEGSLGLSVLVLMIRGHGNDYILSMNVLW